MKLNELISEFKIAVTNEERAVLDKMQSISPIDSFEEREQVIIENLIRKSLVSKVVRNSQTLVMKNGFDPF
jgi:hypothetical protein